MIFHKNNFPEQFISRFVTSRARKSSSLISTLFPAFSSRNLGHFYPPRQSTENKRRQLISVAYIIRFFTRPASPRMTNWNNNNGYILQGAEVVAARALKYIYCRGPRHNRILSDKKRTPPLFLIFRRKLICRVSPSGSWAFALTLPSPSVLLANIPKTSPPTTGLFRERDS